MTIHTWSPVQFAGTNGTAPFVLICEHAARVIPQELNGLGLDKTALQSHAVWDIGALDVAKRLSETLNAPLVAGGVSRLVYDCNRPLSAPDSMPVKSEVISVPGNEALCEQQKLARHALVHEPFHLAVSELVKLQKRRCGDISVLTIHSFTPIYNGEPRDLEIGFLYDKSAEFSQAMDQVETERGVYKVALNQPYDASDGVTYTLRRHAEDHGLDATMIEIRNDLIDSDDKATKMADHLAASILQARAMLDEGQEACG